MENLAAQKVEQEAVNEATSAYIDFLMAMQGIDIHEGEEEEGTDPESEVPYE